MQPVEELGRSFDQMVIVEKYERVVAYLKERARKNLPAEYQQHTEQGCQ